MKVPLVEFGVKRVTVYRGTPARHTSLYKVWYFLLNKRDPKTKVVDIRPLYAKQRRGPFKKDQRLCYNLNTKLVHSKMKDLENYYGFEIVKINPGKPDGLYRVIKKPNVRSALLHPKFEETGEVVVPKSHTDKLLSYLSVAQVTITLYPTDHDAVIADAHNPSAPEPRHFSGRTLVEVIADITRAYVHNLPSEAVTPWKSDAARAVQRTNAKRRRFEKRNGIPGTRTV